MEPRISLLVRNEEQRRGQELCARELQVQRFSVAIDQLRSEADTDGDERDAALWARLEEAGHTVLSRERAEHDAWAAFSLAHAHDSMHGGDAAFVLESADIEPELTETRADESGKTFVAFAVRVRAPAREWLLYRRYSEFESLHIALSRAGVAPVGVALPTKAVLLPRSASVVEARAAKLGDYLRALVAQRCAPSSSASLPDAGRFALWAFFADETEKQAASHGTPDRSASVRSASKPASDAVNKS
jgi:hypothetical protein